MSNLPCGYIPLQSSSASISLSQLGGDGGESMKSLLTSGTGGDGGVLELVPESCIDSSAIVSSGMLLGVVR